MSVLNLFIFLFIYCFFLCVCVSISPPLSFCLSPSYSYVHFPRHPPLLPLRNLSQLFCTLKKSVHRHPHGTSEAHTYIHTYRAAWLNNKQSSKYICTHVYFGPLWWGGRRVGRHTRTHCIMVHWVVLLNPLQEVFLLHFFLLCLHLSCGRWYSKFQYPFYLPSEAVYRVCVFVYMCVCVCVSVCVVCGRGLNLSC